MVYIWRVQRLSRQPGWAAGFWETVAEFPKWDEYAAKALALVLEGQDIESRAIDDLVPDAGSTP